MQNASGGGFVFVFLIAVFAVFPCCDKHQKKLFTNETYHLGSHFKRHSPSLQGRYGSRSRLVQGGGSMWLVTSETTDDRQEAEVSQVITPNAHLMAYASHLPLPNSTTGWGPGTTWACGRLSTTRAQILRVWLAAHACTVVPWYLWVDGAGTCHAWLNLCLLTSLAYASMALYTTSTLPPVYPRWLIALGWASSN